MSKASVFDRIYRSLLLTKFFVKGWGAPENLRKVIEFRKMIVERYKCYEMVDANTPVHITKRTIQGGVEVLEGKFRSPLDRYLPELLPESCKTAYFRAVVPTPTRPSYRPLVVHLAGTGDHGFWRRERLMARPLAARGVASIILENPFYGVRKPREQTRSSLLTVCDLFVMGSALMMECAVLLHWSARQGYGPLALTGISMGGHMASLAACCWPRPLPLVPCLSGSSGSAVFTQGVMSKAINWRLLKEQYCATLEFRDDIFNMIRSPEGCYGLYHELGKRQGPRDAFEEAPESHLSMMADFVEEDYSSEVLRNRQSAIEFRTRNKTDTTVKSSSKVSPIDGREHDCELNLNKISINPSSKETISLRCSKDKELGAGELKNSQNFSMNLNNARNASNTASTINESPPRSLGSFVAAEDISRKQSLQADKKVPEDTKKKGKKKAPELPHLGFTPVGFRPVSALGTKQVQFRPCIAVKDAPTWEALQFMRALMDECTHVANYPAPRDDSLIIAVHAEKDAYEPRDSILSLSAVWPGCELRYIPCGHVVGYLSHTATFQQSICDALMRAHERYGAEGQWP